MCGRKVDRTNGQSRMEKKSRDIAKGLVYTMEVSLVYTRISFIQGRTMLWILISARSFLGHLSSHVSIDKTELFYKRYPRLGNWITPVPTPSSPKCASMASLESNRVVNAHRVEPRAIRNNGVYDVIHSFGVTCNREQSRAPFSTTWQLDLKCTSQMTPKIQMLTTRKPYSHDIQNILAAFAEARQSKRHAFESRAEHNNLIYSNTSHLAYAALVIFCD